MRANLSSARETSHDRKEYLMILKRLGPLSCAKVSGVLDGLIGLIVGAVFSLIAIVGAVIGHSSTGVFFGIGAVVVFPILYGVFGFVGGAIMAWIYNLVVGWTGGIEVEFEDGGLPQSSPSGSN